MIKYIGSKRRLVPVLARICQASGARTALDLFTGTTRVAQAFKAQGVHVTAVDSARYAEAFARTYIETDAAATDAGELRAAITRLNAVPGKPGYVHETFSRQARFFQSKNAARIDAARDCIESEYAGSPLYPILLTSLIEAADRVDSTTGVQMAYVKQWAPRSFNPLELRVPELLAGAGRTIRGDAVALTAAGPCPIPIQKRDSDGPDTIQNTGDSDGPDTIQSTGGLGHFDLAYLDPPYNQHRYFTNYHVWETLVAWDAPEAYGVARKRVDLPRPVDPISVQLQADDARGVGVRGLVGVVRLTGPVVQQRVVARRIRTRGHVRRTRCVRSGATRGHLGLRLDPLRGGADRHLRPIRAQSGKGGSPLEPRVAGHRWRGGVGETRRRGLRRGGRWRGNRQCGCGHWCRSWYWCRCGCGSQIGAGRRRHGESATTGNVSKRDHGEHGESHHEGGGHDSGRDTQHEVDHGDADHSLDYARLEDADLSMRMSKDEEAKRLGRAQRRLLHLRLINGGQLNEGKLGPPVCIVFEGWDAAGKGGAIKRLVEPLDPRHVHIAPFAAPTPDELRHHFLWRFWPPLPGWGGMTIFDRSWYGRVLVERVEGLATEVQWRRAYQEINDFEHTLAEEGMIVIKLWMHMSHEEQLRRFVRRRDDPLKSWKLTDEDWRNREKRGAIRGGGVRHAAPDLWPAGALGRDLGREQAVRAGAGDRDRHPAHGAGDAALGRFGPIARGGGRGDRAGAGDR